MMDTRCIPSCAPIFKPGMHRSSNVPEYFCAWVQISAVFFDQPDQVVRNPLSTSLVCSIPGTSHVLHFSDGACSGKERVKCEPCSGGVFSSFLNKPSVGSLDSDFWLFERE
jgi:hypothetical protein